MEFFDRKYLLQIGDSESGDGISINNLQITFQVRKSINNKNKIDKASISIYNLSESSLAFLETEYAIAVFSCGYEKQDDVVRLFYGEITEIETKKKGVDRVTKIEITPSYSELTFKVMSELVPENGTVEDVFEVIRKQTSLGKGVYKGAGLARRIIYGYPLSGTPKEMLDRVCSIYNLQWKIEGESLYINDYSTVESDSQDLAPVISPSTGLLEKPYYFKDSDKKSTKDKKKTTGVKFTALINPNIIPGTLVRLDYEDESDYYKIEEVDYTGDFRGNNWYMICVGSRRPEA